MGAFLLSGGIVEQLHTFYSILFKTIAHHLNIKL